MKPLSVPAYGSLESLEQEIHLSITKKFNFYRPENALLPHYNNQSLNANGC
jgi:hypothetical protein